MTSKIDSKALSNFITTPTLEQLPQPALPEVSSQRLCGRAVRLRYARCQDSIGDYCRDRDLQSGGRFDLLAGGLRISSPDRGAEARAPAGPVVTLRCVARHRPP